MTDLSWAPLLSRLRADDEQALRELMQAEYRHMAALAYRYVQTPDVAHDIAQDVFIALWERRRLLHDDMHLIAYLRRATRNAALMVLRHDASAARLGQSLLREYDADASHAENQGIAETETAEFQAQVRAVLDTLPERVREIALLYHERGLEPGEIAELIERSPPTVYRALRRTMLALTAALRGA